MSDGNDYSFDRYLNWRASVDYYQQDPFIQGLLQHYAADAWQAADTVAKRVSKQASQRWNECAEIAAHPENHPTLLHFDAHNHRIDKIQRAAETLSMEREIFALGLFSDATSTWQKLIQLFLIYQNGEASICCPLTCTEGLVAMLDRFADSPELEQIRQHLKQGQSGEFAIGAQYLSEIQGGSDVNANLVSARQQNGAWHIYGKKFFCSAAHADYALISARPEGKDYIAAFVVPAWQDKTRQQRNGYRIERLKRKMGTCELPTAEIEFDGALAYALGPMHKGLANIVGVVLACSRVTVGIFSAAIMTRAVREACHYAEFRQAFGRPIAEFPMLRVQLEQMQQTAQRSCAGVFRLTRMLAQQQQNQLVQDESMDARQLAFDVRILIMLQKISAASDSVEVIHDAISVFGGHGVMEDFSVLSRLLRDALVNELWEGPRNVLLAQLHRDLKKAQRWYPGQVFVARILAGSDQSRMDELSLQLAALLACAGLDQQLGGIDDICRRWDDFCRRLAQAFQLAALAAIKSG